MRMLHKTHHKKKKKKWSQVLFSLQILLCSQCVVFPLTLSLPKSARHSLGDKTRYSASSPYFGILYCTALVYNPFASFNVHGKPPLDIFFLLLLMAWKENSPSLAGNVKEKEKKILFTHPVPVWLTFFHGSQKICWKNVALFLSKNDKKTTRHHKNLWDIFSPLLDSYYYACVSFVGAWWSLVPQVEKKLFV